MSEKINIAELLKDCPSGMKLDCTMYDNLFFDSLNTDYYDTINCYTLIDGTKTSINFTKYGTFNNHAGAKCVIFPKGKTTWKGFVPPRKFKDGDVVISDKGDIHLCRTENSSYCAYRIYCVGLTKFDRTLTTDVKLVRLATEEEKQKLFNAIKANGYNWNAETKTLERLIEPKFKVGDEIKYKNGKNIDGVEQGVILSITDEVYDVAVTNNMGVYVSIAEQDDWELVPNKFDITTLVPFESRVLMRSSNAREWVGTIYSHYNNNYFFGCGMMCQQCIPYEGNERLLGTADDCDEYFKNW